MAEAALWENYFELQEIAIIPYNHVVLLHWGVFQISSDNSNKKIYDQKLTFLTQSMFMKVSMTEVKLNPVY